MFNEMCVKNLRAIAIKTKKIYISVRTTFWNLNNPNISTLNPTVKRSNKYIKKNEIRIFIFRDRFNWEVISE